NVEGKGGASAWPTTVQRGSLGGNNMADSGQAQALQRVPPAATRRRGWPRSVLVLLVVVVSIFSLVLGVIRNKLHSYNHLEVTRRWISVVCGGDGVNALHGRSCPQRQEGPAKVVVLFRAAVLKNHQLSKVVT